MHYKILVNTKHFIEWQGGIDLLEYILVPLLKINNKKYKIYIIVAKKNLISNLKYIFYFIKKIINRKKGEEFISPTLKGNNQILNFLNNTKKKSTIIFADYSSFKKQFIKIKPDLVFCCGKPDPISKDKNFGYIFDTQHQSLNKNFSKNETLIRRKQDLILLESSKAILVNSIFMKKNMKKISNIFKNKPVYSIPHFPFIYKNISIKENIKKKLGVNKEYFIVCSQFYKHKNHIFILDVFFEYCLQGGKCDLILTGNNYDYRFPDYSLEIYEKINNSVYKDRLKITGNIKKKYQVCLLRNAKLLIHASLYEGGPGAGGCNEAISLGVPIAVSKILIHNEINYKKINFFNPFKHNELLKLMFKYENKNYKFLTKNEIAKKSKKNILILSKFYSKTLNQVL